MMLLMEKINIEVNFSTLSRTIQNNILSYKTNKTDWNHVTIKGKEKVRSHYFLEQNQKCAYCGKFYNNVHEMEIEHMANASKYYEFIMEPKNLCLVCPVCNQLKLAKDNVNTSPHNPIYSSNTFNIYHPHFDEPSHTFKYCYKYLLRGIDSHGKGNQTIKWLHFNYEEQIKDRIMHLHKIIKPKVINRKYSKLVKKASIYIDH